jgi:hypothetical protein
MGNLNFGCVSGNVLPDAALATCSGSLMCVLQAGSTAIPLRCEHLLSPPAAQVLKSNLNIKVHVSC